MPELTRRDFLKKGGQTAIAIAMADARLASAWAPTSSTSTRVVIDASRSISVIDRRIFGSFLEHLGRAIYEGVYAPGSRFADAKGFRTDVMKEVQNLGVTIVRYPGGNFVSGYHWLDGVGPQSKRPQVFDRAWHTLETHPFGTNEVIAWAKQAGDEAVLGESFGTGGPATAAGLSDARHSPQRPQRG